MVQLLLGRESGCRLRVVAAWILGLAAVLLPGTAAGRGKRQRTAVQVPELLLEGGRKLTFERSISSDRDIQGKRGFFTKVFDVVVGEPDFHFLVRPYSVVADSHGRVIVT